MTKKYEFTGETRGYYGRTLHRIRALIDIEDIGLTAGQLGGWIETEANLLQSGTGWVYDQAIVCGGGTIEGGTIMGGTIRGGTIRGGTIRGGTIEGGTIMGGTIKTSADYGAYIQVGSEEGVLTWTRNDDGEGITLNRGCFSGTLDAFSEAVEKRHGDSTIGREYRLLIEFIRLRSSKEA